MSALARALRLVWRADPWAMSRGAAMTVTVLLMGAALLGLSGWFVTATGLAGLAGIGIAFDVFRPSAGIRFLALGRAGARYAERLLTHDATLRALAALRADLLARALRQPWAALQQARAPQSLTRITADVDALDGVALRVALPLAAAVATHAIVAVVLGWLVGWAVAGALLALYVLGAGAVLAHMALRTYAPSVAAERAGQALRRDSLELLRGQPDLAVQGRLVAVRDAALDRGAEADAAARRLDRMDRRAGASLSALVTLAAATAMLMGTGLVASGEVDAARAALAVFVALALAETVLPLRRGLAEIGRIRDAAGRVLAAPDGSTPPAALHAQTTPATAGPEALALHVAGLACGRPGARAAFVSGLSFDVAPGGALALTGPSGAGKSSVLHALAGLEAPLAGTVRLGERRLTDLAEAELRAAVCLVPQRSTLIGGTIRENLALARAGTEDAEMQAALAACHLADRIVAMGGLDARLAEGGAGLSGGETRRLVLARALLRRPAVLLLDEPTEGLDDDTARAVLDGLRAALPRAAIVTASHRAVERDWAGRTLPVRPRAEVAPSDMQTSA